MPDKSTDVAINSTNASRMTITEALQEIKTINKRLDTKRKAVMGYVARDVRIKDPFEKDGGSAKWIAQERQAIADLAKRIVRIRTEIQKSNLTAKLRVGDESYSVAEWLTWRREIAEGHKVFLQSIVMGIHKLRAEAQKLGGRAVGHNVAQVNVEQTAPPEVAVNVDEAEVLHDQEYIEQVLGELDGKLSLFNATTVIEF